MFEVESVEVEYVVLASTVPLFGEEVCWSYLLGVEKSFGKKDIHRETQKTNS